LLKSVLKPRILEFKTKIFGHKRCKSGKIHTSHDFL
jgi:hypothetical protein